MNIACISTFTQDLKELLKKPKDRYQNCLDDLLTEIESHTIDELTKLGDALTPNIIPPDYYYRKIRIKNSQNNQGKSSGFRLICVISPSNDTVIFLKVYPKIGNLGMTDITSSEKIRLVNDMVRENGRHHIFNKETRTFELPIVGESL